MQSDFSSYTDFYDYCQKTKQENHQGIKTVLEEINRLSDEIKQQEK